MSEVAQEPKIVETDLEALDGQTKCPKCGATDIALSVKKGVLRCNFCRFEFEPEALEGFDTDISKLSGSVVGSGAADVEDLEDNTVTLKCDSCGAQVVIDTAESTQARCHWCRNTLSINQQLPNGAVPDAVLPFAVERKDAKENIEKFVEKRKFFANPQFKKEFTTDNVMGVYLPYMLVDINSHVHLEGQGEHEIRCYTETKKVNDKEITETYYDADLFAVERDFDMAVENLTVESSSDKLDKANGSKTNNIINSIMPFDTENCVKWDSNYLKGYSSEKRDTDISELRPAVEKQVQDVARFAANETLEFYDRGVCWQQEKLSVKGEQWKTAYLPVWLYSYRQKNGMLHYVAVNARTKETMGSVPIHKPKLFGFTMLIEVLSFLLKLAIDTVVETSLTWLLLAIGVVYFFVMYNRYRNSGARHAHELETKRTVSNMQGKDDFIKRRNRLRNSNMKGANNTKVNG